MEEANKCSLCHYVTCVVRLEPDADGLTSSRQVDKQRLGKWHTDGHPYKPPHFFIKDTGKTSAGFSIEVKGNTRLWKKQEK